MQRPIIKQINKNLYEVKYPNLPPQQFNNQKPVILTKADSLLNSLHPKFQAQVGAFLKLLARRLGAHYYVQVNDALRTDEEQMKLYQNNPQYAKVPGESPHNYGVALDFSVVEIKTGKAVTSDLTIQAVIDQVAKETNVYWGGWFVSMPKEPWHVQIARDWKKAYEEITKG